MCSAVKVCIPIIWAISCMPMRIWFFKLCGLKHQRFIYSADVTAHACGDGDLENKIRQFWFCCQMLSGNSDDSD